MSHNLTKYGEWALVTGGSSGIGYEIARQLVASGMKCILISRTEAKLAAAVTQLGEENSQYRVADLSVDGEIERIAEELHDLDVGLCVHCAGTVFMGHFLDQDTDNAAQLLGIHIQATSALVHIFGQRFQVRGGGGFILVSSGLGYAPIPLGAVYAAAKAYVLSFGQAMHHELKTNNIDVVTLVPGGTKTNMANELGQYLDLTKLPFPMGPVEPVAHSAISALVGGNARGGMVIPGAMNKLLVFMMRILPGRNVMAKTFGRQMGKALLKPTTPNTKER